MGSPWGAWFPPKGCALWVNQHVYTVPASVSVGVGVSGAVMGGHPVGIGTSWSLGLLGPAPATCSPELNSLTCFY